MAKCPKCGINWQWDWCGDIYRKEKTGEYCDECEFCDDYLKEEWINKLKPRINKAKAINNDVLALVCDCKQVLSVEIEDYNGPDIINHPEWKDVDWEEDGNIWEEC